MCHKNKHINKPSTTIVQFHSYLRHCYYLGKQHVIILGNEISTEDTVRPWHSLGVLEAHMYAEPRVCQRKTQRCLSVSLWAEAEASTIRKDSVVGEVVLNQESLDSATYRALTLPRAESLSKGWRLYRPNINGSLCTHSCPLTKHSETTVDNTVQLQCCRITPWRSELPH
jgi:hypothetical protein